MCLAGCARTGASGRHLPLATLETNDPRAPGAPECLDSSRGVPRESPTNTFKDALCGGLSFLVDSAPTYC